jgi:hypothetical protein
MRKEIKCFYEIRGIEKELLVFFFSKSRFLRARGVDQVVECCLESMKHEFKPQHHKNKNLLLSLALVAHTCNPSYSGGRDQANSSWEPILKTPITQ